ncbi:MAG: TlpA disulfide reductase family protein [Pseudohongiellaceae bacterium]|nr:TlpA disulfide reductase family protein [Pseudohongiellaceae bacterium]
MRLKKLGLVALVSFLISLSGSLSYAIEEGEQAPLFTLANIEANEPPIVLESFRGKTVYVDFWASWCAPCLRSMPLMDDLYVKYRDRDFEVIAINVDTSVEDGQDFLADNPVSYHIALDTENTVLSEYGVIGMPTSYLVDKNGIVQMVHMGFKENDIEHIEKAILELIE